MQHVHDFINKAKPLAVEVEQDYGIPYGVIVAQAALETGWGQSVKGNNYFGIKGQGQSFATHEFVDGKRIDLVDSFRAYESMSDSFADYGRFLTTNPRYKAAFLTDTPAAFAQALQAAGYATDPKYASKLINIMDKWGLEASAPTSASASASASAPELTPEMPPLASTEIIARLRRILAIKTLNRSFGSNTSWDDEWNELPSWLQSCKELVLTTMEDILNKEEEE